MRPTLPIAIALMGCSEHTLIGSKDAENCASVYWPDEAAAAIDEPQLWDLVERWRVDTGTAYPEAPVAAPMRDANGDGVVDGADGLDVVFRTDQPSGFDYVGTEYAFTSQATTVHHVDGATGQVQAVHHGSGRVHSEIVELDPGRPGPELLIVEGDYEATVSFADLDGVYDSVLVNAINPFEVWLTDLHGAGDVQVALAGSLVDLDSAQIVASFPLSASSPITGDLDGDGTQEIIAPSTSGNRLDIVDADGSVQATCTLSNNGGEAHVSMALAQLDVDAALEIVAGSKDGLVVCDRDGTVARSIPVSVDGAIAVAELDGDPWPELLVPSGGSIHAYHHDLQPLLQPTAVIASGDEVIVGDLDGDGVHEIITRSHEQVLIVRATGTVLATYPLSGEPNRWLELMPPLLALGDIDADGLAEIVVAEWGDPGIVAIENARGGWDMPGAGLPWMGHGNHPGARDAQSRVTAASSEQLASDGVWNGLAAVPPICGSALSLEIRDVCVDSCQGDATVTAYVSNTGVTAMPDGIEVTLTSQLGEVAREALDGPLSSETARVVQFVVPSDHLFGDLELSLDPGDASCEPARAIWSDPTCDR